MAPINERHLVSRPTQDLTDLPARAADMPGVRVGRGEAPLQGGRQSGIDDHPAEAAVTDPLEAAVPDLRVRRQSHLDPDVLARLGADRSNHAAEGRQVRDRGRASGGVNEPAWIDCASEMVVSGIDTAVKLSQDDCAAAGWRMPLAGTAVTPRSGATIAHEHASHRRGLRGFRERLWTIWFLLDFLAAPSGREVSAKSGHCLSGTSISSSTAPRHLPCASSASERVTPPASAPCSTKLSAPRPGSS